MSHVTFIHGIANKPPKEELRAIWRSSLADGGASIDLGAEGVTSEMVYWADVIYESPLNQDGQENATNESAADSTSQVGEPLRLGLGEMSAEELAWTAGLAAKLAIPEVVEEIAIAADAGQENKLERIPLPWAVKARLMKRLLRDVHHYLFNVIHSPRPGVTLKVRNEIRQRTLDALRLGAARPGPHLVISHSMGTVIAYDVLERVADAPQIDALITLGSPLGIDEVQDKLRPEDGGPGWSRRDGFPTNKLSGPWSNFFDHLDPICGFDPHLANDFRREDRAVVKDASVINEGSWRHDIAKYLRRQPVREAIRQILR